jgi:hypothetical protein
MQGHLLVKFDGIFGLVLLATRLFVAFEKDSAMLKISENIVATNMYNLVSKYILLHTLQRTLKDQ